MTIQLPKLPDPIGTVTHHTYGLPRFTPYPNPPYLDTAVSADVVYTLTQVRAIQCEAMRVALEAAAKLCRDFHATDSLSNYGLVLARMIEELEIANG